MDQVFEGFPHVVRSQQFSREWIEGELFETARRMERITETRIHKPLHGKRMVSLFYQPSTRTRMSFQMAWSRLGGEISFATENGAEFSSEAKGESLEHSIKVTCCYDPDVIILRHHEYRAAERAAAVSSVPLINAGDGPLKDEKDKSKVIKSGQHPTQAQLDLFTIAQKRGRIDGLSIAFCGDLAMNRVVRSLAYLLAKFDGITIYFVAPSRQRMNEDVITYLKEKGVEVKEVEDLREIIGRVDVVYMLRTWRENGSLVYDLTQNFVLNTTTAGLAKPDAIFMHPLPIDSRVQEIKSDVERDSRSVFLNQQVKSGLYIRMALLEIVMKKKLS